MRRQALFLSGSVSALVALGSPAGAVGIGSEELRDGNRVAVTRLVEGLPTLAPFAHVIFCKTYPDECRSGAPGQNFVELTPDAMQLLRRVNVGVNKAIRAVNDKPGVLNDTWSLSPAKGDCEDYAITKRHQLIRSGLPASALRLVTAVTTSGEGHAALVVSTDRGDLLLDNRYNEIVPWNRAQLTVMKVQSASDPRRWHNATGEAIASNE